MIRILSALIPVPLAALGILLAGADDRRPAMLVLLAAGGSAFLSGRSAVGRGVPTPRGEVEAAAVRAYRARHPEASISEAITALDDGRP